MEAEKKGFRSIVYNRRGFEGIELTGRYMLSWPRIEDFDEVIAEIRKKCPVSNIFNGILNGIKFHSVLLR